MATHMRNWLLVGLLGLLVACGGGGGGNSASGVEAGPPPPGQPIPPEPIPPAPSATPYAKAEVLNAFITSATLNGDNQPVIQFTLSDGNNVAITDLTSGDVRFVVSKLEIGPQGNLTGTWQAYVNVIAEPESGFPGTVDELQANYERDDGRHPFGEFTNNGGGNYSYQYETSLTNLPQDILDQAAVQGLDLSYDASLTHRVAIQFDGAPGKANPNYDWEPATGATDGIFTMDIAATANCNRCHDPLALHGTGRQEVKYCVTCHNPGTTDPESTNTVDMKVMIHKIHMGANLPSVNPGGEPYYIVGFNGSVHDYSNLHYPQDIRNCVNCHVGTGTVGDREDLVVTSQGDNWAEYPTRAACGSCHDDVDFDSHRGGQPDDSKCASCHSEGGPAGSIEDSHIIPVEEARKAFKAEVLDIASSMPGQTPVITFKVSNPLTAEDYDVTSDPVFTDSGGSLSVKMSWDTGDYTNTGNEENNASSVAANAVSDAVSNGDGSFNITMPLAIPDGSDAPGIAASGSGVATIEGHPVVDFDDDGALDRVPVGDVHKFFSIDEADGDPEPRRKLVDIDRCNVCHSSLILHGSNRADDIDSCVTCHNPRNTDRVRREGLTERPSDGKLEESIHFKTMIHGIHAAGIRENPLLVYGFGGSAHLFDEDHVHFPGDLANCTTCHTEDGYKLPLASTALATSVDTGDDQQDPTDDVVTTPITATCASCHDDDDAAAHMQSEGGNFSTSQAAIDDGEVKETCNTCHSTGRIADVAKVHNPHPKPIQ